LSVAGCATMRGPTPEQISASEDAQCRSYGAQPGTPAYLQCRLQFQRQAAQADQQRRALAMQYLASRPPPYQLPPPVHTQPTAPRNCTSEVIGSQVYTRCY
jgi:hypothetical protein